MLTVKDEPTTPNQLIEGHGRLGMSMHHGTQQHLTSRCVADDGGADDFIKASSKPANPPATASKPKQDG
jgi:hypothetical protein